ncbi:hypothetical protein G7Z17_g7834 [Cylindrodendrum hubeiense]|uniref:CFEM domain-containing protein n=1 Tax=Cylindrodendrum hubeiense TaxID=595255 RepID=A0A9P5H338_9HYPO|nr:hypothetical protein G7Z17_g7834 [Cylindrodendrum hubeiense]
MILHRLLLFFTTTALVATTAAATDLAALAQFQANLPKCAVKCLAAGVKEHGCESTDVDCQCTHLEAIIQTTSPCLVKAGCDLDEISDTANLVATLCASQIANLTASQTTTAAEAAKSTGAAALLPQNLAWAGAAAAMAVAAAAL